MFIMRLFAFVFSQWAVAQPLPPLPARPLIPLAHCQAPNVDALLSTDVPRTYWLQSFGMSGARYRDATIHDLGPVASQPVLTLTGPFELTADHIRIRGTIETAGFPITLQARVIEFLPGSRIIGFLDGRPGAAPTQVPDVAGPQQPGLIGLPGAPGLATVGPITLAAMYVRGHPVILGQGQQGGAGGPGGKGGIGAQGVAGAEADCTDLPGGHDGLDGGRGGAGAIGGRGGPGGPGGAPISVTVRMGAFTQPQENLNDVVSLAGVPGAGGPGGPGGDGGQGGNGGNGGSGWFITCDPGHAGPVGDIGGQGPIGETGAVSGVAPIQGLTSFSELFAHREAVFREAYWVHLWRSLSLRFEEFTRATLRMNQNIARDPSITVPRGVIGDRTAAHRDLARGMTILRGQMEALWLDVTSFPFFGPIGAQNGGYRASLAVARCDSDDMRALTSRAGLLAVLWDARQLYSNFGNAGFNPNWTVALESINQRLRVIQPEVFERLQSACRDYGTQLMAKVAQNASELLGVPLLSIPICEGQTATQFDYILMPVLPGGTP